MDDEFLDILYAVSNDNLYTVNVGAGAATLIGANGVDNIDGLAWVVPEPSTVAIWSLLACLGAMGLRRQKQRKS